MVFTDPKLLSNVVALAPLGWLMARTFALPNAGWWTTLLFALPLYTTRVAYHRFVEMRDMFTQTISSLSSAVDAKDHYTAGHSKRVQEISVEIGRQLRCSEAELEGFAHDLREMVLDEAAGTPRRPSTAS